MKKSAFLYVLLTFFLVGIAYVVLTLSTGSTSFFGRAEGSVIFSAANSYIFASPLLARAGGDKIRVTVFALDGQGKGVANKSISLSCKEPAVCQQSSLNLSGIQPLTDTLGQAVFDVSAAGAGKLELQATVDGIIIPQTVTITFR